MTERWVKMVEKAASEWEGPDTQAFAVKLLARQHRAFVRMAEKRSKEYMRDALDGTLSKPMRASAASKAWAFKDFADDLVVLAKQGARKKD